jgi:hypothetical protein
VFHSLIAQLSTLFTATVCLWALLRGRWPEQATAVMLILNWIGSAAGEDRSRGHHGQPIMAALDITFLVFSLGLTVSCRRTWTLWMSACALLGVLTHLAVLFDPNLGQWSYMTVYFVWSLGLVVSLAVGMAVEGRRPVHWLLRFA